MIRRSLLAGVGLLLAPLRAQAQAAKPRVVIKTGKGVITVELEAQKAPITTANFLNYVQSGKYDGGTFFRSAKTPGAPTEGTIVAGPNIKAHPFPPIAHESTTKTGLRHVAGTISLGRFAPGTATGNFFICASDEPYLDAHPGAKGDNLGFAAFGHVIEGMAVVHKILGSPADGKSPFPDQKGQWLEPPVRIISMRRVGYGQRRSNRLTSPSP